MYHKIYIGIITALILVLSWTTYSFTSASNEYKADRESLNYFIGNEQPAVVNGKDLKACRVNVIDKNLNRTISAHRYVISKDNICPKPPEPYKDYYITKDEYIKELQNNKGWGIFDDSSIYPETIPLDLKTSTSSSQSK